MRRSVCMRRPVSVDANDAALSSCQVLGRRAAPGAASDNDDVVLLGHRPASQLLHELAQVAKVGRDEGVALRSEIRLGGTARPAGLDDQRHAIAQGAFLDETPDDRDEIDAPFPDGTTFESERNPWRHAARGAW